MITEKSKEMMTKSFKKSTYLFKKAPKGSFNENYGIYIHVPFCETVCNFCPFYKEKYSENLKLKYLEAIINEIRETDISGTPHWIYFGGGTPNTLSTEDLSQIIGELKTKIKLPDVGIELLPRLVTDEYLKQLKEIGVTKISLGIESLQHNVLDSANREFISSERIKEIITLAKELGFWINVDMMLGLPGQEPETFIEDIKVLADVQPSQITTYPYMVIRKVKAKAAFSDRKQFELIEEAGKILGSNSYQRQGIWIFALGSDVYDSSRDELITDYAGFGPAAFSTFGSWKVVNPDLEIYLQNYAVGTKKAFVAPKTQATDDWRNFARMIYDLDCFTDKKYPGYINFFIRILKMTGFSRSNKLTEKGIYFAHDITKTVVESLPFPLQNKNIVENYTEYKDAHKTGK